MVPEHAVMPFPRRLAVAFLALTLALLGRPLPVAAHAYLERAEPAPDSVLPSAPSLLRLWFTETLEPSFSEVVVVDAARQPVHTTRAQVSADGLAMTLALPPLPDGAYTVTWKTLSTVDGHPARGFYSLTIGAAAAPAAVPAAMPLPADEVPLPVKAAVRWLAFTGQALLVGSLLAGVLVLTPALAAAGMAAGSPAGSSARRRQRRLAWAALIATAVAALAALPVQAATAAGLPLDQALGAPLLPVLATRYGLIWSARVLLLALLAGMLLAAGRRARLAMPAAWLAAGLGLGLLLTTSLTSHAAALREGALPAVLADWLHLIATSLWLGGLALLIAVAPAAGAAPAEARPRLLSVLVGRFSALALGAVAVLIATGAAGAALHLDRLDALWTTDYGRALLTKLLLLPPMLALGALNLLGVRPALARAAAAARTLARRGGDRAGAAARAWRRLGRTVRAELALGVLILAATGVLTSLPPAPPAPPAPGLSLTETAADLRLTLAITPAQPGDNTLTLTVTRNGRPAEDISRALLRLTLLDQDLGESEVVLAPAGAGRYVAQGRQLSVIGQWQAEIIVRRDGRDDARSAVRFAIPASAAAAGAPAAATPTLTRAGMVALVMLALAAGLVLAAVRLRRAGSLAGGLFGAGAGAVALAVYLLVTSGLTVAPGSAAGGPRNPFPPVAQSLAQGRALYTANCQTCHGAGGRGDGPAAAGLNPPPLDLTQHVGFHADAELYRMISQGVRGTAMPAFAGRLTDEERWHLVNYIRTFDAAGAGSR
jgi:copper transport protein